MKQIHILGCVLCIPNRCDFLFHLIKQNIKQSFPLLTGPLAISRIKVKDVLLPRNRLSWPFPASQKGKGVFKSLTYISMPIYGPISCHITVSV